MQGQETNSSATAQASPISTAEESPQAIPSLVGMKLTCLQNITSSAATGNPDFNINTEELQQPGGQPSSGSAEERTPSSSLATLNSARDTDDKECHNTEEVCAIIVGLSY